MPLFVTRQAHRPFKAPMHQSSFDKMLAFKTKYLDALNDKPIVILDLGSLDVNGSYQEIFDRPAWHYRGLDMTPGKNVDIVLKNPYHWKEVGSNSVDVLVSGQAFEHIEFFWISMLEIARVLKPGGLCCIIAPSGGYEHKYPVDCWRFYPDGFSALARFARLKVIEVSTQWELDDRYDKRSNSWHDSMLVCRKHRISGFYEIRQRIWRWVMHRVLTCRLV
ncbi:MAG: methyltransferase domain-containing protein [Dissulfuribacterales bacterium]